MALQVLALESLYTMILTLRIYFVLLLLLFSLHQAAMAGPNWDAIDDARAAKQEQKKTAVQQRTIHESALQQLKTACEKVKANAELSHACDEILAADEAIAINAKQ